MLRVDLKRLTVGVIRGVGPRALARKHALVAPFARTY
jgi:hypothetical protein